MEFKERFKGRTSNVTKIGVLDTLAGTSNPVQKSHSSSQLPLSAVMPTTITNTLQNNAINQRVSYGASAENRPIMQPQVQHSLSKSPAHSSNQNQNPQRIPSGPASSSAHKNPYLVNNPFPSLDAQDNQYMGYNNNVGGYGRSDPSGQRNTQQVMPNDQFNPNSFYNQHSQYKNGGITALSPKKENIENYGNFEPINTNQAHKKNFENLTHQNKQKRMAEEALRGLESPHRNPNSRYEQFDQMVVNYNRPPLSMPGYNGYNGYRDIHSNPVPHQHFEPNAFGHFQGNQTYQADRGRPREEEIGYSNQQLAKNNPSNNTNYKPYSIRDYKDLKTKALVKLGGLGPNTNTGEWYKEKEKRDKMTEFSQNVKVFNSQRIPGTESNFKPRKEKEKEKSRREIALEFAKNVPKPRQRRDSPPDEEVVGLSARKIESDKGPRYVVDNTDLDEFEQKHMQYVAQLERMKMI